MTTTDDRSDSDLLRAYGRDGDERAFEVLAGRHVDMIFAVSLRRSNNRQLAEEATQNVLLSLSRKARRLSAQESHLIGWLHTSTRFEVSKLQRRETRIKTREQAYARNNMKASTDAEDEAFQRLYPLLDQAIDHLRAPDREVIVRRYLEGQNFRRIGEALGISEDAAQKRTSRAFERLNQFFRRKAGVTVSATALVAGLSRHCAEAAPAACLQFTTTAASTGLASALTTATITTMSIGKISAIAAGVFVLGGGIAYLATQDPPPSDTVSTPPPSASGLPSTPTPTARPVVAGAGGEEEIVIPDSPASAAAKPYSPNEELAKLEAMSPHPGKDEFARRLGVKQERLLKDLTKDLGLSAAQVTSVKEVMDSRLDAFRAALDTGPQPGDSETESLRKEREMLTRAGEIIRSAGLREDLADILSDEQLVAFDEREANAWQSQVESHAYTEFSKITPILALTEEQKDRTFEILQTTSEQILRENADERAFMALQKNQSPTQMDLTDPADMEFIAEALEGPNPLAPGSPEFNKRIIEVVGGRINERVELLAPVLDERQTQRYRDHLVQRSILNDFGIKLPTPEEP